jgi:hypothetical protein
VTHGFVRAANGTIKTFDPTGSTYTRPQGVGGRSALAGYYAGFGGVYHGFVRAK